MDKTERDKDGLEPVLDEVRRAYRRIGEPSGEMLLAYHDGQLSEDQRQDMELILCLRPDLREEILVRVEMRAAPAQAVGASSALEARKVRNKNKGLTHVLRHPALWASASLVLLVVFLNLRQPEGEVEVMPQLIEVSQPGVRAGAGEILNLVEGEPMTIPVAPPRGARHYLLLEIRGKTVVSLGTELIHPPHPSINVEADSAPGISFLVMLYTSEAPNELTVRIGLERALADQPILSEMGAPARQAAVEKAVTGLVAGKITVQLSGLYQTVKR